MFEKGEKILWRDWCVVHILDPGEVQTLLQLVTKQREIGANRLKFLATNPVLHWFLWLYNIFFIAGLKIVLFFLKDLDQCKNCFS